jgi:hypothetical protein
VDGDSDKDGDEMGGDEDDSDLDLAWKMLDIARAIVEKSPDNTMEKVKILSALAEVSMERGILCHPSYSSHKLVFSPDTLGPTFVCRGHRQLTW